MPRPAIATLYPLVLTIAVFFLGVGTDRFVTALTQHPLLHFADNLIAAIVVGCIVLFYERRRHRYLATRLQIIRGMNHHVRNALQVISYYAASQKGNEDVRSKMLDSVTRIDWALREILPADTDPESGSTTTIPSWKAGPR